MSQIRNGGPKRMRTRGGTKEIRNSESEQVANADAAA